MGLEDTIKQILLPMQDEEEVKDGQKKVVSRKVFPGYLLIEMEVNDHQLVCRAEYARRDRIRGDHHQADPPVR